MEIKSKNITIEKTAKLVSDPKNENIHSEKQINALCKIISINGFREPLTVSNRSGYVICGNGRLEAAKLLGMEDLPVIYQDFENEADELRHRLADNEIARHSELDRDKMIGNIEGLNISIDDFDFNEIGVFDFQIENIKEVEMPDIGDGSDPDIQQMKFTLSNEQVDIVKDAMDKAKSELDCIDDINENSNGNKLTAICRLYVNS